MNGIRWSRKFDIDGGNLDGEHQKWIELSNRVLAVDINRKDMVLRALGDLVAYTRKHFASEERRLAQLSYDRLEIQKLKHQVILAEMRYTIEQMPQIDQLHEALSELIHNWVENHILGEDILIRRYLQRP